MNEFLNKRILITGASKGLGKAAAIAFEKKGANLAIVARDEKKIDFLKKSFVDSKKHIFFKLDLLDSKNIKILTNNILDQWSKIDVILHCIGGSFGLNETLMNWDDFAKSLKGNIGIASEINKYIVPIMKTQGYGNIIHVGSVVGYETTASIPYSTAKAALSGYIRSLGKKLIGDGIIVAGILPGSFYGDDNSMFRYEYYKPEEYSKFVKSLPQKRIPRANEFLPMIFLLSNPESKVLSGSLITMDGSQGNAYFNYSG